VRTAFSIVITAIPVSRILLFFLIFAHPAVAVLAAPFTAFRDGEKFVYRVGFAVFNRAGEITITAHEERGSDGQPVTRIESTTASRGLVRGVYEFNNHAQVVIERETGRLLSVRESGEDPKRATDTQTILDYEHRIARHSDRTRPGRSAEIPIPEGNPLDLVSALVQTRDWNLQPGQKREVLVHFGRDFYPLSIHAEGFEEVRTPLGRFRTLVLVPRMEQDPKGLFKRGGEIKVWIAQDGSQLPVKMQLKLKYGTAVLQLADYQPPATTSAKGQYAAGN
jgi:hypothetical protein